MMSLVAGLKQWREFLNIRVLNPNGHRIQLHCTLAFVCFEFQWYYIIKGPTSTINTVPYFPEGGGGGGEDQRFVLGGLRMMSVW